MAGDSNSKTGGAILFNGGDGNVLKSGDVEFLSASSAGDQNTNTGAVSIASGDALLGNSGPFFVETGTSQEGTSDGISLAVLKSHVVGGNIILTSGKAQGEFTGGHFTVVSGPSALMTGAINVLTKRANEGKSGEIHKQINEIQSNQKPSY